MVVRHAGLKVTFISYAFNGGALWINSLVSTSIRVTFGTNTTSINIIEALCSNEGFFRHARPYILSRYYDTTRKEEKTSNCKE